MHSITMPPVPTDPIRSLIFQIQNRPGSNIEYPLSILRKLQANEPLEDDTLGQLMDICLTDRFLLYGDYILKISLILFERNLITQKMLKHRGCQHLLITLEGIKNKFPQSHHLEIYLADHYLLWAQLQNKTQALHTNKINQAISKQMESKEEGESKSTEPLDPNANYAEVESWLMAYAAPHLSGTDLLRALNFILAWPNRWQSFAQKANFVLTQVAWAVKGRCKPASARSILEHITLAEMNKASLEELGAIVALFRSDTLPSKYIQRICSESSFLERNLWTSSWEERWNALRTKIYTQYDQRLLPMKLTHDPFQAPGEVKSIHSKLLPLLERFKPVCEDGETLSPLGKTLFEYIQKIEELISNKITREAASEYFNTHKIMDQPIQGFDLISYSFLTLCSQIVTDSVDLKAVGRIVNHFEFEDKSPFIDLRHTPSAQELLSVLIDNRLISLPMLNLDYRGMGTCCRLLQKHLNSMKPASVWNLNDDYRHQNWIPIKEKLLIYYKSLVDQSLWECLSAKPETLAPAISNLESLMKCGLLSYLPFFYLFNAIKIYQQAEPAVNISNQISLVIATINAFYKANSESQAECQALMESFLKTRIEQGDRAAIETIKTAIDSQNEIERDGLELFNSVSGTWIGFKDGMLEQCRMRMESIPVLNP